MYCGLAPLPTSTLSEHIPLVQNSLNPSMSRRNTLYGKKKKINNTLTSLQKNEAQKNNGWFCCAFI